MYLKKLEISGFKSFANKTILFFEPGITAVVGPNGSGKSNIADAIRWAMGEQSAKSLRGRKNEDAIFAGSDKKARCSMASVFLSFSSDSSNSDEIEIGRKIFRDGTGQYFINGAQSRLADVSEILSKEEISQGNSAIIRQGMSDMALNASPAERRAILEEAIGIKQFRIKRDQSVKKLDAMNQNAIRISDLLAEIEPRLANLRRQAAKAQKRGEVESKLKNAQMRYFSIKFSKLKTGKRDFSAKLREIGQEIKIKQAEMERLEKQLKIESKEETSGQGRIFEIKEILRNLYLKRREAEKEIASGEGGISVLKNTIKKLREKIEKTKLNIAAERNKKQMPDLNKESQFINIKKEEISKVLNVLEAAGAETALEKIKKILTEARNILKNFVNAESNAVAGIKNKAFDASVFENQISEASREIELTEKSILNLYSSLESRKSDLEMVEKEIAKFESEITSISQEDQKRRSNFFEIEREIKFKRDEIGGFKEKENLIKIEESKIYARIEDTEKEIKEELKGEFRILEIADVQGLNLAELEAEIRRFKGQLDQIGGIDNLVLREYKETEERFSRLSKEFEDLKDAKKNLENLISKLTLEMSKKFKDSFKEIAEEFEKYFKLVFGGGESKILCDLCDEEEGGVEIFAAPPGKKTKNLSMLSGGERALTSLALLFAIIGSAAPPFCVLDEVDAALDEANSLRIGKIFGQMKDKTQLIVITHNREIMRRANTLYGVTMQKDGISKILSVKLEK